ncbi:MAG: hypothetical protein K1X28_03005 [Parachlamydiales bacterium]|nr:hypothetical protein [Parachlamydiales bacterium]
MNISITPVLQTRERTRNEVKLEVQNPIDSKVRGLVLEKIGQTKGALLPSASASQIISFLLPGFEAGKMESMQKKRKNKLRKTPLPRKTPIGLMPADPEGWVNALMQFILYVPGFAESFSIAPRSLFSIQDFIDQYHQDLAEGRSTSTANGLGLMQLFGLKFPNLSLKEVVEALIRLLIPKWTVYRSIYEALLRPRTIDLLIASTGLKKQLYADPGQYYDLNAFVEKRPDGALAHYIAYVKVEGGWYQCDNDRVTQLRSDMLALPLQRTVISHYRQVSPLPI